MLLCPCFVTDTPPGRKRKASLEDAYHLESEFAELYTARSNTRKRMLNVKDKKGKAIYSNLVQEINVCKEVESFLLGWMEGLDWEEGQLEAERGGLSSQLDQGGAGLAAGLEEVRRLELEAIQCADCRMDFSTKWNKYQHRSV